MIDTQTLKNGRLARSIKARLLRQPAPRFENFTPPGRLIDIGGRRLYARFLGERRPGQPLVVFEAGHADWSKCWAAVQPEIARFARTMAYDRAGSGWSDPGTLPRTPEKIVHDLHALLRNSGEPGPYLFVGHSMGGAISRLYYHYYPHEVYGMVWVDSAHERMDRYFPFFSSALFGLQSSYRAGRVLSRLGLVRLAPGRVLRQYPMVREPSAQAELLAQVCVPRHFEWLFAETAGFASPGSWENTPNSLDSLPVISIEAQYNTQTPPVYAARHWGQFITGWKAIQEDLSRLSSRTRRVPVNSGHAVMFEQPECVVKSVADMLQ